MTRCLPLSDANTNYSCLKRSAAVGIQLFVGEFGVIHALVDML